MSVCECVSSAVVVCAFREICFNYVFVLVSSDRIRVIVALNVITAFPEWGNCRGKFSGRFYISADVSFDLEEKWD